MAAIYNPEPLHDAFILFGSSASALIGLLFIAVSLHLSEVIKTKTLHRRAYNNTIYLLIIVVESVAMLVPQPLVVLGVELVAVNVFGFAILWGFVSNFFLDRGQYRHAGGQLYIGVMLAAAFGLGIGAGAVLMAGLSFGAWLVVVSCTILIIRVVLNAWNVMVWIGDMR